MKTLIFSDTHLTDKFYPQTYKILRDLIQAADSVIINGDFWDGWRVTFDDFISSSWNMLFPLLKSKSTVYIFGNHDSRNYCDHRITLFSDLQSDRYLLREGDTQFIIEHGDLPDLAYKKIAGTKIVSAFSHNQVKLKTLATAEGALVRMRMLAPLLSAVGLNHSIKKRVESKLSSNDFYICGHTHLPEYDGSSGFINSGYIRSGWAHYVIIEDGNAKLHKAHYAKRLIRKQFVSAAY